MARVWTHGKVKGNLLVILLGLGVEAGLLVGVELVGQCSGSDLGNEAGEKPAGDGGHPHDVLLRGESPRWAREGISRRLVKQGILDKLSPKGSLRTGHD